MEQITLFIADKFTNQLNLIVVFVALAFVLCNYYYKKHKNTYQTQKAIKSFLISFTIIGFSIACLTGTYTTFFLTMALFTVILGYRFVKLYGNAS